MTGKSATAENNRFLSAPALWKFLWISTRGYRLRPWASPYLRWRIETYWGWRADDIGVPRFFAFLWEHKRELLAFLRWAARMGEDSRLSKPAR